MTLGSLKSSFNLSLAERLLAIGLVATALLSTFSGWLFQVYTDTLCHQKLLFTFLLSILFWVATARLISKNQHILALRKNHIVKDAFKSIGTGLGLVAINQVLIVLGVGVLFKFIYNCEVLGGWSQELIINNISANVFSFSLIFGLVQWNKAQEANDVRGEQLEQQEVAFTDSIWIKDYNQQTRLPIEEIIWVKADNNCIHLHSANRKYVVYRSLKSIEQELDPARFVRIHRSKIVNRDYIARLKSFPSGDGELILNTGEQLRYSRTFKRALLA